MNRDYFEHIYADSADPWDFASSPYERRKYDLTLAALPRERYGRALEPGCSIGVLTADLAARCASVEAWEPIAAPRREARRRTAALPNVTIRDAVLGADEPRPGEPIDLVVLSEVLYYLSPGELDHGVGKLAELAAPGAHVVAVHWRHPIEGMALDGDAAHRRVAALPGLAPVGGWVERDFRIDVFAKAAEGEAVEVAGEAAAGAP